MGPEPRDSESVMLQVYMLTFQGKWTHPASQPSSPLLTQSWFFMIRISPWVWGKDAVNLLQWLMISVWLNCQFPFHNQEDSREKTRFWLSNQNKSHSYLSQYFLSHISLWCISFPFPCFGQFLLLNFVSMLQYYLGRIPDFITLSIVPDFWLT